MDTLPNVNTRRGGENPSSAGLTSCALPEAQSIVSAESSHTVVSTRYAPSSSMSLDRKQTAALIGTLCAAPMDGRRMRVNIWRKKEFLFFVPR